MVVQISIVMWMVFKIFKTVSPTVISRWWFVVGYYFCTCVFEIAFLEFGYSYYKNKPLKRKVRALLSIFPILQFILILTNPYHFLFYSKFTFFRDSFGPGFYVHMVIEYIFIAIGIIYCYKAFKIRLKSKNKLYKYLVSSAIVIPLILNFLYITRVIQKIVYSLGFTVVFDVTPIVFTWSLFAFVYATFRENVFDITPIMQHQIVHKLDTPIAVLQSNYDIIYVNERLEQIILEKSNLEAILRKASFDSMKIAEQKLIINDVTLMVTIKEVKTIVETQYLLTAKIISDYEIAKSELNDQQIELQKSNKDLEEKIEYLKELSKISARD